MRLTSASVLAALALTAGCAFATPGLHSRPSAEPLKEALKSLGIEGKTYVNDLGEVSSVHLKDVHVFGDDLLVEDIHGHLVYIDGKTLYARWEYRGMDQPFTEKPCATEGSVVGISHDKLYVLTRDTGYEELPPRPVSVVPAAAPVANESTLFVPTYRTPAGNKTLMSVSLATGAVGWGWRTANDIVSDLAIAGEGGTEIVYAASSEGTIFAFPAAPAHTRTIEPSWTTSVHSPVTRDVVIDGTDLGIVTDNDRLVVLDRIAGTLRFEGFPDAGDHARGPAQFGPKHVFYEIADELRAFDRTTGARAWAVKGANQFVAERGTRTLVRGADGTLTAVDTKTGKVLGRAKLANWTFPRRAKADGTIYAVGTRGMLAAIELGW